MYTSTKSVQCLNLKLTLSGAQYRASVSSSKTSSSVKVLGFLSHSGGVSSGGIPTFDIVSKVVFSWA